MKIYTENFKGMECYVCENHIIKIKILEKLGGKVVSIYYKPQQFEVLYQNNEEKYAIPEYAHSFEKYDTSGWDEMYPTIDRCKSPYDTLSKKMEMPDHGELWSIPWEFNIIDNVLKGTVSSPKFNYVFHRDIEIKENTIHVEYEVKNIGKEPLYGIWAFHGLLACDDESRIIIEGAKEIINVHKSQVLGDVGKVYTYPTIKDINGNFYELDKIHHIEANKTEKFYVNNSLEKGEASITLNRNKVKLDLNFPQDEVPYLGVWINEGGFKNQYNCALEPSTGFYDSVEIAKENNKISEILPGEKKCWYLNITINEMRRSNNE